MRQRAWDQVADDPRFPFMVGRLIGAAEGGAALLRGGTVEPEQQKAIAERLAAAAAYFIEPLQGGGEQGAG